MVGVVEVAVAVVAVVFAVVGVVAVAGVAVAVVAVVAVVFAVVGVVVGAVVVFDLASRSVRGAGCPVVVRRRRKSFPRNCRNCCRMWHCPRFDSRNFCKVSLMSLQS